MTEAPTFSGAVIGTVSLNLSAERCVYGEGGECPLCSRDCYYSRDGSAR
jgi:hypothetical protein